MSEKEINPFKVGDLVIFKKDKDKEVCQVEETNNEFCYLNSANWETTHWVRAKHLKLLNESEEKEDDRND